jgi:diguanylate cyclase (GGDEF)-like protein
VTSRQSAQDCRRAGKHWAHGSVLQNRPVAVPANKLQKNALFERLAGWSRRAALIFTLVGAGAIAAPLPPVLLGDDGVQSYIDGSLGQLLDNTGQRTLDDVATLPAERFAPVERGKPLLLENGALWLRFDAIVSNSPNTWRVTLPLPGVDDVKLYHRTADGQWLVQQAGDSRRMSSWPQQGRYPVFNLSPETGRAVTYFMEIHHPRVPFSALPRVVSDGQLITSNQEEHTLLGIYFGLAALVIALALANAIAYRDWGFGSYATYMAMFAGAQGAFTGVAGLYWWPELPALNNISVFLLPVGAGAAAMWFVRTVTTPRRFSRALDWLMLALMSLLPAVGLLDALFPTVESCAMINTLIAAGMLVLLMVVGVSLVEGDRHARWLAAGFLPVLLATLFPLLRNLGFISSGFLTEYGMMLASALEAPILFYGLLRRVSQRREPSARATSLRTSDPLTGLYTSRVLVTKLHQAISTAERYQQPFALLLVNVTNLGALQGQHGREVGDRAMVMAAARIRAVARQMDTVARAGDSQFALLMEGPVNAAAANDAATRILASGLRPSNQLPDAEPLQFHIAVGHSGEPIVVSADDASACLARLLQTLKDMNDGSRKAIRLVRL